MLQCSEKNTIFPPSCLRFYLKNNMEIKVNFRLARAQVGKQILDVFAHVRPKSEQYVFA